MRTPPRKIPWILASVCAAMCLVAVNARGSWREESLIDSATATFQDIMACPPTAVPRALLLQAQAIGIFPGVIKGGLLVEIQRGFGALVVRGESGVWHPPMIAVLSGESVGLQAGVQATDVILVFRDRGSAQDILQGKYSVAMPIRTVAGPLGFGAAVGIDAVGGSGIYCYTRCRGQCSAVALEKTAFRIDGHETEAYYKGTNIHPADVQLDGYNHLHPSAVKLLTMIDMYARAPQFTSQMAPQMPPPMAAQMPPSAPEVAMAPTATLVDTRPLQRQLADAAVRLQPYLDETWRSYLALPPAIYSNDRIATPDELQASLDRFKMLLGDPRYATLTQRPEFQQTFDLIRQCMMAQPLPRSPAMPGPYAPR